MELEDFSLIETLAACELSYAKYEVCIGRRFTALTVGSCHSLPVCADAPNVAIAARARVKRCLFIDVNELVLLRY